MLNKIIEEHEAKEEIENEKTKSKMKERRMLAGKLKQGVLVSMDGRDVIEEGTIFADNGESVEDYISRIKAEMLKKRKKRREMSKRQAQAAEKFYQQTGLSGVS